MKSYEITAHRYLSQIPTLMWTAINRTTWETIQDEGLDEEQNALNANQWSMASLQITPEDASALQAFDDDMVDDFNRFDIGLKERYPSLVDFIDYDAGTVTIVKPNN